MRQKNVGFTLIEIMVVAGMLAIISSIALSSYQGYIKSAESSIVSSNFSKAVRSTKMQFANAEAYTALGLSPEPAVPNDVGSWLAIFNTNGVEAPGAGLAYEAGPGNATRGAIGVQVSGTFDDQDLTIVITRPAFYNLPLTAINVTQ
jgi:prepilin-type N-terminal cleavage/methylation domain-containing protein